MSHFVDKLIMELDKGIRLSTRSIREHKRPYPAQNISEPTLSKEAITHSAGLMRVNQAGEICAQALYRGQSLSADLSNIRKQMEEAADEELDHLAWCNNRLQELGEKPSLFNPLWYGMSFMLGVSAGLVGDKWSLGFVEETEKQVVKHLEDHNKKIHPKDTKSKFIIDTMRKEEELHAKEAKKAGAAELPSEIKNGMSFVSKVMTSVSYYI